MPGPVTTHPKNRWVAAFAFLLTFLAGTPAHLCSESLHSRLLPGPSVAAQAQQPAGTAQSPPAASSQEQNPNENGTFVIRKDVDEVLLHATVVDDKQRIVTDLTKSAFTVFEDGKPQTIISFHHEDIPVAMGIVIDNSGSMREKRAKVNQAALNLVRSSNPQDEVFVVNFNDEYYLDQDFTNDLLKLKEALEKIDAKGGTALYEAVVASAENLRMPGWSARCYLS